MLEYVMMRNELIQYLTEMIKLYDILGSKNFNDADAAAGWHAQMFVNDFILDDINIQSGNEDWIGVVFYNASERVAVQNLGSALVEFYQVGKSGDYSAAFKSSHWHAAYAAAKVALELMRQNDLNPLD